MEKELRADGAVFHGMQTPATEVYYPQSLSITFHPNQTDRISTMINNGVGLR
jgi:hypothetical protein